MRNEVLFGGDDQYRKIYREDLIRQATPNTFKSTIRSTAREAGHDGIAQRQRPDRQARHTGRCSSRIRSI